MMSDDVGKGNEKRYSTTFQSKQREGLKEVTALSLRPRSVLVMQNKRKLRKEARITFHLCTVIFHNFSFFPRPREDAAVFLLGFYSNSSNSNTNTK